MTNPAESAPAPSPVLRPVDPGIGDGELSVEDLGSRIVGLAGRLAAATCQWLLLVARFDEREGCARFGLASTARWLTHACGLSRRAAADHVKVARTLASFPVLAAAMSAGRVSYSHVRAIARVARPGEERTVADLLEVAESGTVGQLETIVRGLCTVEDLAAEGDARPAEYVRTGWSSNGQWQLNARLDPERGALVNRAVEAMATAEDISTADALDRIAEVALAVLDGAGCAPVLRGDERAAVIVHLDLPAARAGAGRQPDTADVRVTPGESETPAPELGEVKSAAPELAVAELGEAESEVAESEVAELAAAESGENESGENESGENEAGKARRTGRRRWRGRIADGPGLPDAVIERLLCEGRVRTSLYREDGSMFDLGRTHRVVSKRLFRALLDRDGGCTHPGCGSRSGLEAHHVRHWMYGGRTDLANLILLCRGHHHAHHRDEFTIGSAADGGFVFRRPDGLILEEHVDPSRLMPNAPEPSEVPVPCWTGTGQRLDRHWAIAVLSQRRENARQAA